MIKEFSPPTAERELMPKFKVLSETFFEELEDLAIQLEEHLGGNFAPVRAFLNIGDVYRANGELEKIYRLHNVTIGQLANDWRNGPVDALTESDLEALVVERVRSFRNLQGIMWYWHGLMQDNHGAHGIRDILRGRGATNSSPSIRPARESRRA
tara:strand:- start:5466 stop:5927 length:462 start_codon:yes stop_codon:yes gene_type:complete